MASYIRRRKFLATLGGAVAWPIATHAQQPAMPVVGFLRDAPAAGSEFAVNGLRKGLAEAGFVEGQNLTIEYVWTDGQSERLSALAAELVGRHVLVIVSSALNATYAAKAATSTIPVVFAVNNDPVATGLVASLNRPGGNLTGVAYLTGELGAKRLGLMHEIVPKVADFAVLAHPTYPSSAPFISDVKAAARTLGLRIEVFNASTESEIDAAFAALSARRLGALLLAGHPLFHHSPGADHRTRRALRGADNVYEPGICQRRRPHHLWAGLDRGVSPDWRLRWSHPQGREGCRPSGAAADQV